MYIVSYWVQQKMIVSCSLVSYSGNSVAFCSSEGEPHLSSLDLSHFPNLALEHTLIL